MKKNHSCNVLKVLKIIRIILSILLLSYTLSLCIIGHCSDAVQDPSMYYPIHQNTHDGFVFDDGMMQLIENLYDSENNYIFAFYSDNVGGLKNCYVSYCAKVNGCFYGEIKNDMSHFGLYVIATQGQVLWETRLLRINPSDYSQYQNVNINNNVFTNLGYNDYAYISNFQMYNNNNPETQIVILAYGEGDEDEDIPDGDVAAEDMERPDIDNYIPEWTNTPTFDNSSVENAIESVFNGITWLAENIKGTITGTAEYMADTVRWTVQKVIDTIRGITDAINGKIQEVKNSILTVVVKIQDTFDYISQPYDSTKINTAFNNMAIKSDYNNMTILVNNAVSVFDSTSEPNTFRIPVHLENIPILHINEVQYIELGWIYDSRSIIRAFMWCVTTFSLLYTIIDALPSYLQGNDE